MAHFGLEPRTIHVGSPNENGDVEAGNGALQRALAQQLLLRGSGEFGTLAAYAQFLVRIYQQRNARRQSRLAEELAVMRQLAVTPLPDRRELRLRVSCGGICRVLAHTYSVASGLKGKLITAQVGEWEIGVWYGGRCWETLPRLTVTGSHHINYRQVIGALLRKPGGLRDDRYRDDLFPTAVFRQAWEALCSRLPARRADLAYLRLLKLAAETLEADVAATLATLLAGAEPWDDTTVAQRVRPRLPAPPELATGTVDLTSYDALLHGAAEASDDAA